MSAWGDTAAEVSNWMSQQVVKLTFADRFKKNSILAGMMQKATPQAVCSDAPILKIQVSNSVQSESAVAGSSIGAGGGGLVIEPALTLYSMGVPIDLADEYLAQIDVADAKDRITLSNHLDGWREKAWDITEFAFSGVVPGYPGCLGYVAGYVSATGVVTMSTYTPDVVFDKFIVPRARFDVVVMSTGLTETGSDDFTGYVKSVDKAAKTFVLVTTKDLTSTTYPGATQVAGGNTDTTYGLYFYGQHAAAPGLFPFGLNTLFNYHSSAAETLFGQSGYTYAGYQPATVAGAETGLTTKMLNRLVAGMYLVNPEDNTLVFPQEVYGDYEETVGNDRTVPIPTDKPIANIYDIGLKVNGKFMPIETNPYWNGSGRVYSIPTDELMMYYSKANRYQSAGGDIPGWAMRFPQLQPSTTYYNSVNQLFARFNFGIKGNRRKAGVITGLEKAWLA